ncbi:MAG: AAC(3) family N-acetyltransferase [Burkholderiales bacterium]
MLLVHAAFSQIAPVQGGPHGLIEALLAALGGQGTLVMPSMADDDDTPFDRRTMPCRGVGILADAFWRLPGVLRSDSPHAFAAVGPHAERITMPHPVDVPHGLNSPPGRVYQLDGQVLLLGVGHDADTTIGRPKRYEYGESDHCCENFRLLDVWLAPRQRRGRVGNAEARLARSRDIVSAALERLRGNETVFLHESGSCSECDAARAGAVPFGAERGP